MNILREGQSIQDTYQVERFLGEGANAEVYRVKHRVQGRQAMKVFKSRGDELAGCRGHCRGSDHAIPDRTSEHRPRA